MTVVLRTGDGSLLSSGVTEARVVYGCVRRILEALRRAETHQTTATLSRLSASQVGELAISLLIFPPKLLSAVFLAT